MLSADDICRQFGPRSGPDLVPNCLTLMVFIPEILQKFDFEKKSG